MFSLKSERELNNLFSIKASFYNINAQIPLKCRNLLDIFRRKSILDTVRQPDGIFIMMNSGGSEPLDDNTVPIYNYDDMLPKNIFDNKTHKIKKPDQTQYQVMRVMDAKNWNYVKVINLSDIRESKSDLFFKKLEEFEDQVFLLT